MGKSRVTLVIYRTRVDDEAESNALILWNQARKQVKTGATGDAK